MGIWFIMEGMIPAGPGWTGMFSWIVPAGTAFAAACIIILSGAVCRGAAFGIVCTDCAPGTAVAAKASGTVLAGGILEVVFPGNASAAALSGEILGTAFSGVVLGSVFMGIVIGGAWTGDVQAQPGCGFAPISGIVPPGTAFDISFILDLFSYNDSSATRALQYHYMSTIILCEGFLCHVEQGSVNSHGGYDESPFAFGVIHLYIHLVLAVAKTGSFRVCVFRQHDIEADIQEYFPLP